MIDSLKIGAITYAVKQKDDLHSLDDAGKKLFLHGHIVWSPAEIRVAADQQSDRKIVTVWHEALHGILEAAGQDDQPEPLIRALSFGLVQLLRDNPQLVELTVGKSDGDQPSN